MHSRRHRKLIQQPVATYPHEGGITEIPEVPLEMQFELGSVGLMPHPEPNKPPVKTPVKPTAHKVVEPEVEIPPEQLEELQLAGQLSLYPRSRSFRSRHNFNEVTVESSDP